MTKPRWKHNSRKLKIINVRINIQQPIIPNINREGRKQHQGNFKGNKSDKGSEEFIQRDTEVEEVEVE